MCCTKVKNWPCYLGGRTSEQIFPRGGGGEEPWTPSCIRQRRSALPELHAPDHRPNICRLVFLLWTVGLCCVVLCWVFGVGTEVLFSFLYICSLRGEPTGTCMPDCCSIECLMLCCEVVLVFVSSGCCSELEESGSLSLSRQDSRGFHIR